MSKLHRHAGGTVPRLADLHLHLYGSVPAADLLTYLAARRHIEWDWYEDEFQRAYGYDAPTRQVVERYRRGDLGAIAEFERLCVFGDEDAGNFDRFSGKGNIFWAGSVLGRRESTNAEVEAEVRHFAAAARRDQIGGGVRYAEYRLTRFGPDGDFVRRDRFICDLLLDLFDVSDRSITERFVVSLTRTDPWSGWEQVKQLALGPRGHVLTGIDFCGQEEGHPPKGLRTIFEAVQTFNQAHPDRALAILAHVGESFRDKSLESAIRWVQEAAEYGAHRLGHAIALGVDPDVYGPHARQEPVSERRDQIAYDLAHATGLRAAGVPVEVSALRTELAQLAHLPGEAEIEVAYDQERLDLVRRRQDYSMERVRGTGAVVEVCPTSNRRIGGIVDPAHHPVGRFLEAGLPIVVCSDDPGVFGITVRQELEWVGQTAGLTAHELQALADRAWACRSEVLTGRQLPDPPSPASRVGRLAMPAPQGRERGEGH